MANVNMYRVKWPIIVLLILLIASTLLNVVMLTALLVFTVTTPPSCPQAINTTQMAQNIVQEFLSSKNDDTVTNKQLLQQIYQLINMSNENSHLRLEMHMESTQQILTDNFTTLINISNDNAHLLEAHIKSTEAFVSSCREIKNSQPNSTSGYYHINSQIVFCEMGELCGTEEGGWTRLGYLDMTDTTTGCPSGFKLYQSGEVRACGRPDNKGSCSSVKFPSNSISYSEVCGRVVGYQFGSTDVLDTVTTDIDSYYVDGVSITQGYPRKHIWTLMAGYKVSSYDNSNCPCNTLPGNTPNIIEQFIGNDYFCESGNPSGNPQKKLYLYDPLWDGEQCLSQEANCCLAAGLPWFHKTLDYLTTNYLELRVCGDSANSNEDSPVSFYELYVK